MNFTSTVKETEKGPGMVAHISCIHSTQGLEAKELLLSFNLVWNNVRHCLTLKKKRGGGPKEHIP